MNMIRTQRLGTVDFVAFEQTKSFEIRGALKLRALGVRLKGKLLESGGATDGTAVTDGAFAYMKLLELVENGGKTLYKLSGGDSAIVSQFMYGVKPDPTPVGASTGSARDFEVYYEIPFSLPRRWAEGADDTIYNAAGKILTLELTLAPWKKGGFRHDDSDRTTGTLSEVQADIEALYVIETGATQNPLKGKLLSTWNFYRNPNVPTGSRIQQKIASDTKYRALIIRAMSAVTSANTGFNPSDTPLNGLTLESAGLGQIIQTRKEQLRARTQQQIGAASNPAGSYLLDFCPWAHQSSDHLNFRGTGDVSLFFDVTKPTHNLDMVTIYNELFEVG